MGKPSVKDTLAEAIARHPRVESAKVSGDRIRVTFPRMYGGVAYFTIPRAKAFLSAWEQRVEAERKAYLDSIKDEDPNAWAFERGLESA